MRLLEYQGKELFQKYGIAVPTSALVEKPAAEISLQFPVVLKSQVLSGDRKKKRGIRIVEQKEDYSDRLAELFGRRCCSF